MKQIDVRKSTPFDGRDLATCQPVFDELIVAAGAASGSEEAARIAGILLELYKQGVHDPEQLRTLVGDARGLPRR